MKTFALALGAGGARGLAHIAVFEALDELGLKPVAIAGSSIGALAGAAYAAGMTGKALRHHVLGLAHNPTEVWRRLMLARAGKFGDLFGGDFSAAMRLDPEKLCDQSLPDAIPGEFGGLGIPLSVIASDLNGRREVVLTAQGKLLSFVSRFLPGLADRIAAKKVRALFRDEIAARRAGAPVQIEIHA